MLGLMMLALPKGGDRHGSRKLQEHMPAVSLGVLKLPPPPFEVHSHALGKCLERWRPRTTCPVILAFGDVLGQVMALVLVKKKCERTHC